MPQATAEGLRITNNASAERLNVFEPSSRQDMTLLFLGGRAATPLEDGGSVWADAQVGRLLSFDSRGRIGAELSGAPRSGPALSAPVFAVVHDRGILAVEGDGRALLFEDGEPAEWIGSGLPAAPSGGRNGVIASTRTVFDIQLHSLDAADPLLWLSDSRGVRAVGRIRAAEQAILAPIVNAGWVAMREDGSTVFASAVRPEIHLYDRLGELQWVSTWSHAGVTEPTLAVENGALIPRFRLIQQAVAIGSDDRIYLLATSGADGPADRLLVFDRDGTLLREGSVEGDGAIYVRRSGHVFLLPRDEAMVRTAGALARVAFDSFDLPSLVDSSRVRLLDHRGKVVVVNFWASWCGPCRREMPLLDSLTRELDPRETVVIGVNDDLAASDALAFLREIGGVGYANAAGSGRMRGRYGYRGLPYTVVLDREGRLRQVLYGFGQSIAPVREAVLDALREDRTE